MNLVILTRQGDGKKIYVNPNNICTFCKNGDRTIISFVGNENCYINVLESPEAIANLIELGESKTVDDWIPVTERPPEIGESVMICDAYDDICIGHRTNGGYYFPDFCEDKIKDVRAWAELPEPYKGVTE